MIKLISPENGAVLSLETEKQKEFVLFRETPAEREKNEPIRWDALERSGKDETVPAPVAFEFLDDRGICGCYFLAISEYEDMSCPMTYPLTESKAKIYNLKVDTRYFWQVFKDGRSSEIFWFRTAPTLPRNIRLEGIVNIRDIGGYTVSGGRIRQGMVYRGGELDRHMHLTALGVEELRVLGIKTEIDMRAEAIGEVDRTAAELLGARRVLTPLRPYVEIFDDCHRKEIRRFFKVFLSRKNYPIYFHCWGGADRTGSFAFILGAFLGMSYDDLLLDYEYTTLAIWSPRTRLTPNFVDMLDRFDRLEGERLCDKARSYLKDYAALSDDDLDKIYSILVEKDR